MIPRTPRARRAVTGLYVLALTWSLLAPASTFDDVGELLPHQDKLAHALLFIVLGALARWSSAAGEGAAGRSRAVLGALLAYAVAIECLQPVLGGAGRRFDWLDLGTNLAGALSGWLLQARVAGYHDHTGPGRSPTTGRAPR